MTETAMVTQLSGKKASVRFIMSEGCHACGSKDNCSSAEGRILQADVPDAFTLRVGDTVRIEVPASAHIWGMFFLVLLPVFFFGTAYLLVQRYGSWTSEGPAALAGIAGLALGLVLALFMTSRGRLAARPKVIELVRPE